MSESSAVHQEDDGPIERAARLALFGYPSTDATARLYYRDFFWRGSRALLAGGLGLVVSPVVALVPPHAPWAIGALAMGGIMARRKWVERRTLIFLDATCPKCEAALRCARPTRMKEPHTITCESCHYEMELQIKQE